MNYLQAREAKGENGKGSGLWRFTQRNDNQIWAIGYCAEDCAGHDTAEGAERHWYDYEMDHARYDVAFSGAQYPCVVCQAWTAMGARLPDGYETHVLCDEHRNRAGLDQIRPFVPGRWMMVS